MLPWATLLSLFAVTGPAVASENKAILSFYPPWTTVFEGETVTLMCDVPDSTEVLYTWYRDSIILTHEERKNRYPIPSAKTNDSGEYSCETFRSGRSDPVRLTVSNDWVILQTPSFPVFEGETLHLQCLGWEGYSVSNVRFYKDDQRFRRNQDRQTLSVPHVTVTGDSGTYTCEMKLGSLAYNYKSAAVHMSVRELFPPPVLEISPSASPPLGSSVSLMCKTELPAQRRRTKLLFTFYKDWQVLGQKSDSPKHNIKEAQLENSGEYFCEVETENSRWPKQSSPLQIHVQRSRSPSETSFSSFRITSRHSGSQILATQSPLPPPDILLPAASLPDERPQSSIPAASLVLPAGPFSFLAEIRFCSPLLEKSGKAEEMPSEEKENIKESPSSRGSATVLEKCRDKKRNIFCDGMVGHQMKASMEEHSQGDKNSFLISIKNLVRAIQEQNTAFESLAGRDSTGARPACATDSSLLQQISQSVQGLNTDVGKIALEVQMMGGHLASIASSLRQIAGSLTKDPINVPT